MNNGMDKHLTILDCLKSVRNFVKLKMKNANLPTNLIYFITPVKLKLFHFNSLQILYFIAVFRQFLDYIIIFW